MDQFEGIVNDANSLNYNKVAMAAALLRDHDVLRDSLQSLEGEEKRQVLEALTEGRAQLNRLALSPEERQMALRESSKDLGRDAVSVNAGVQDDELLAQISALSTEVSQMEYDAAAGHDDAEGYVTGPDIALSKIHILALIQQLSPDTRAKYTLEKGEN
jgi:hypothetical protein